MSVIIEIYLDCFKPSLLQLFISIEICFFVGSIRHSLQDVQHVQSLSCCNTHFITGYLSSECLQYVIQANQQFSTWELLKKYVPLCKIFVRHDGQCSWPIFLNINAIDLMVTASSFVTNHSDTIWLSPFPSSTSKTYKGILTYELHQQTASQGIACNFQPYRHLENKFLRANIITIHSNFNNRTYNDGQNNNYIQLHKTYIYYHEPH